MEYSIPFDVGHSFYQLRVPRCGPEIFASWYAPTSYFGLETRQCRAHCEGTSKRAANEQHLKTTPKQLQAYNRFFCSAQLKTCFGSCYQSIPPDHRCPQIYTWYCFEMYRPGHHDFSMLPAYKACMSENGATYNYQ